MSRKRFSHGRTAIHLSNQFQPQLLLSGSKPEGTAWCLDPACHCANRRSYVLVSSSKKYVLRVSTEIYIFTVQIRNFLAAQL
jgi:hypothetical protein